MSDNPPEITRTVAIEVEGKKVQIEVHVHLSKEEIRAVLVPAVMQEIARQVRVDTVEIERRATGYFAGGVM